MFTANEIRREWVSLWLSKLTPQQKAAVLPTLKVWQLEDCLPQNNEIVLAGV